MPQIFKIGAYLIFFWSNEGEPLDPIHVHIIEGIPSGNATKVWITKARKCLLSNNNSKIPERTLRDIIEVIEARAMDVANKWYDFYGEISYYC